MTAPVLAGSQVFPPRTPGASTIGFESEKDFDNEHLPAEAVSQDVAPNGGFGWICVACVSVINAHTWGLNASYGVFLAHYLSTNSFPGASGLDFAFIGGLSVSQSLLISPLATTTTKVFGTRTTLLIGVFFETLSLIGASFANKIWHLYLTQGICFGWGMGFLFVGSVVIVPQWFTTKRGLANGLAASGSGLGGLVYSLAANAMIKWIDPGWAFRILGMLAFVGNFTSAIIVKDRNKQIGTSQLAFDYRLLRRVEFLLLLGFGFLSMLGYIVILFSLPSYAQSIGMTAKQGSIIGAVLSLGQMMGRAPIGYFSDAVGRINMAGAMTFLAGLFCLVIWACAKTYEVLIIFALIGGMVAGTFWAVVGPVTSEVVGLKDLSSALSITWLFLVLPTTFSEAIGLEIVAGNGGSFLGAQLFAGFMYVGAALCMWWVRAWKIGELENVALAAHKPPESIDPVTETPTEGGEYVDPRVAPTRSNFSSRLFMWRKV